MTTDSTVVKWIYAIRNAKYGYTSDRTMLRTFIPYDFTKPQN